MGTPQARITDLHICNVPVVSVPPAPPAPIPIGPPCMPTVLVGKKPAARVTDMTLAAPPHPIIKGSMTVLIGNLPAARVGDLAACGGAITLGELTVLVGG
ncbi:hypothetical protein E0K89_020980 [Aquicoccus sp. SCR17]|nr:hypothetical protein [Carideicomes alvinocaridis]